MVRVFADSTCDLSKELLEKYRVTIIPLHILMGDREYLDGVNVTPDEIYQWSDQTGETPKTSAVGMEEAMEAFRPVLEVGDEILVFSISGEMSTTSNVFRLAAKELESEERVAVIDSRNLSTGIGLLVIEAAKMAGEGKSLDKIREELDRLIPLSRASFVVDTLVYLHRGGRCSGLSAMLGSALKLHPRIVVEDGKMHSDKKYRGKMKNVYLSYAADLEESLLKAKKDRVFITNYGAEESHVAAVKEYLESLKYFDEVLITRAGGVISSHCGPGTLGVLFLAEG